MVKRIVGFHIGEFERPRWTDREPTIKEVPHPGIVGIEAGVLKAYDDYLQRLGEWTFGFGWVTPRLGPGGTPLEFFVTTFLHRLWPTWGRRWTAVGATPDAWSWRQVILQERDERRLYWVDRRPVPYNIILRYREKLWWAREVPGAPVGLFLFEQGPDIGYPLMFERRGPGVAKKNEDEWNFGMCFWEGFRTNRMHDMFLWHSAEVRYLGFGIRVSATLFSLQRK